MGSLWPGPWWLVLVVALCFIVPSIAVWAAEHEYEEKDYSGGFSTDLFFPYLDYNEKDGAIPGFDWDASSDMGVHRLSGRGGVGTDSGKEQLMLGYTYLGWYPALGANLFDRNTFFEDYTDNNNDEDDWLKELGGNLFVSWPFDVYHRISFAYELESVDMPNETTRLSSVSLSLVRDTAQYYMLETISGTQVNLTAEHGHDSLGSEQNFES